MGWLNSLIGIGIISTVTVTASQSSVFSDQLSNQSPVASHQSSEQVKSQNSEVKNNLQSSLSPSPRPPVTQAAAPKRHRIQVTVTAPEDIKVKQDDRVKVGDILADRTAERQRLEAKRNQLKIAIEQMSLPLPQLKELPEPNFERELIAIEKAKFDLEKAQEKLKDSRFVDPVLIKIHDPELAEKVAKAEINLAAQIARLDAAKTRYQQRQYEHSLSMGQHQTNLQRQQYNLASLVSQLEEVEGKLSEIAIVRSPYVGKVRRVKITGQNDRFISAEITLDVRETVISDQLPVTSE